MAIMPFIEKLFTCQIGSDETPRFFIAKKHHCVCRKRKEQRELQGSSQKKSQRRQTGMKCMKSSLQ
jgi:hypothetical protein